MKALDFTGSSLKVLDQRKLPHAEEWNEYLTAEQVAKSIEDMEVRGAPAIGAAAAFGIAVEADRLHRAGSRNIGVSLEQSLSRLASTRPTAVNLFWAIERMRRVLHGIDSTASSAEIAETLKAEAEQIAREDVATNKGIGAHGASLFGDSVRILTHCNTGSLATVEYGTALGIIRRLRETGQLKHVWVDETRPYLQGARLTAFELKHEGIPHTLITDSMAAHFMKLGQVDAVIVGADRIAANGDTANKIGTYGLAVLCQYHGIPFYVAAPKTTFDFQIPSGDYIPIEERKAEEVTHVGTLSISPEGTPAAHPAFDVTPQNLIDGIVTEYGVIHQPNTDAVREFFHAVTESSPGSV